MGLLLMSEKERLEKANFEMVKLKKITLVMAAVQLERSYRQAHRMYQRYLKESDAGLIHKARGRASNHKHPKRSEIIARYKEKYQGFGPTLAAEYLEEDQLKIDHETLRRLLLAEKLWQKQRKRSPYRRQRECRAQFGELLQIDGSIHDWFEESKHRCLINIVDDATSKTHAHLESGETTAGVFRMLWKWMLLYGIPMALYVDLKTVYVSPKDFSFSHVEKACQKLGIRVIKAYSAQAKGRVERKHAVYQDRFVKALRLKNIKTEEKANALLEDGFIDTLNRKFEKRARHPESAHRPLNGIDLNQILCWEYDRQVQNDWTFSFFGQCYQVEKPYGCRVRPKATIGVRRHLDSQVSAWYRGEPLGITAIPERPKATDVKQCQAVMSVSERGRLGGKIGKQRSPWGRFNPHWLTAAGTSP